MRTCHKINGSHICECRADCDPHANPKLAAILPTIDQLAAAPAEERWNEHRAGALLAHLQRVGASGEVIALSAKFQLGAAAKVKLVNERIKQWLGTAATTAPTSTGGIAVSLPEKVDTVEPLRGLPITSLSLNRTRVTNLEPLRGMPLRSLSLYECKIRGISPLPGMPLRVPDVFGEQN